MNISNELPHEPQHIVDQTTSLIIDGMSDDEVAKLVHELWTRRVELEIENEDLRKTLTEIRQHHEEVQRMLQTLPMADGIAVLRSGTMIFVNNTLSSLFDCPSDQLLTRPVITLVHPDYARKVDMFLERLEHGAKEQRMQWVSVTKKNREVWLEGNGSRIVWQGQPAVLLAMRDITDLKLREISREEEQERPGKHNGGQTASMNNRSTLGNIIGKSTVMQEVYEQISKAAGSDASVCIYGESGTGKELIARTIHTMSKRRQHRFVPVNCGAIPETLFESEFFGHKKGSFTGAFRDKQGFFSAAHNGTLFLDELGELTPSMQVKLLRVLDDGEYTPVGETMVKKANVRIIAATNRNFDDLRRRGIMREDFFFRIHVFTITVPPLRNRREDIPLLMDHFLRRYREGTTLTEIPVSIMNMLYQYNWPGNVREFQNAIQRYLSGQPLNLLESRAGIASNKSKAPVPEKIMNERGEFQEVMDDFEKKLIVNVLEQHRWNKSKAAINLGIPRRTLYRKMEKYGIG